MRKLNAFNDIVERTMRSRYGYGKRDRSIKSLIFKLLDKITFTPDFKKITHDPGYNPLYIHLSPDKYIETNKLISFFEMSELSSLQAMIQLTTKNDPEKYLLRNTFSLILFEIIIRSGVNAENLFNTHLFKAYEVLQKEFFNQYSAINYHNLNSFYKYSLTPFSDVNKKVIAAATSDNINDFPLFCSKTQRHRYKEHETFFREVVVPNLLKQNSKSKSIHIISLGCSRADDLYDIYEILYEFKSELSGWDILLEGRDINSASLAGARDLFQNSKWINFRLVETNLADPDSINEINNHDYDLLIFRKAAMYLDHDIQDIYREKLRSRYIFSTSDFIPDKRYRMISADTTEPAYIFHENREQ